MSRITNYSHQLHFITKKSTSSPQQQKKFWQCTMVRYGHGKVCSYLLELYTCNDLLGSANSRGMNSNKFLYFVVHGSCPRIGCRWLCLSNTWTLFSIVNRQWLENIVCYCRYTQGVYHRDRSYTTITLPMSDFTAIHWGHPPDVTVRGWRVFQDFKTNRRAIEDLINMSQVRTRGQEVKLRSKNDRSQVYSKVGDVPSATFHLYTTITRKSI